MLINAKDIIDLVQIENKYAIFSTYKNDVIFHRENINTPIFCGGIIKSINQNVYNFKISEMVGYISYKQSFDLTLSTNQIVKITTNNEKLIAILPYASYAMKILRLVNPSLNQNIVIVKDSFFSILLERLIKLSGANVFLIDSKDYSKANDITIDIAIYYSSTLKMNDLLSQINCKNTIDLKNISLYDKGLEDLNYLKGVKYPYPYVRWDYKRNLEYFIDLLDSKKLLLDFFEVQFIEIIELDEIIRNNNEFKENSLILFKIV